MVPGSRATIFSTLLTLPTLLNAITFDCKHVLIDGVSFDISPLSGQYSIFEIVQTTPTTRKNTTFTLDVCNQLGKSKGSTEDECPNGSQICAFERHYHNTTVGEPSPDDFWPIAGEFLHEGRPLDPQITRLKGSDSHADAEKEGFRLELNGGLHKAIDVKQKAFVEFVCDHEKTGLEGMGPEEEQDGKGDKKGEKEDKADGDSTRRIRGDRVKRTEPDRVRRADAAESTVRATPEDPNYGRALQFVSYKQVAAGGKNDDDEIGVLRLEWTTKYACEDQKDKPDEPSSGGGKKSSSGWGFFTWFIIVIFLLTSAYLIFGSWLNYSRYGARGWDLLPHGDTLRDLPYLVKDWARRVMGTVQGSGGGRGYSAV